MPIKNSFSAADFDVISRNSVYSGFFTLEEIELRHRLFDGNWSKPFTRELFIRGDAVGVLLYDPHHDLVGLVEQFRVGALEHSPTPWLLEVVAGIVEEGERAEEVALREVEEEAGITQLAELVHITDCFLSPGGSNERIMLYCGVTDLQGRGGIFGLAEENEDILLNVIPVEQAYRALAEGRCNNAPLTISLLWLQLNEDRLKRDIQRRKG